MRLKEKMQAMVTQFNVEMEASIDRMATLGVILLSVVAGDQLLVKRLAYDVKTTRLSLDLVLNEVASLTQQDKNTLKLKYAKMSAMYDKPPSNMVLIGGDSGCPFNKMLHRAIRVNWVTYLSPQHYALVKTAEFIGDDIALDQLQKRTLREGVFSNIGVKFDPIKYALKENKLSWNYLGTFYKEAYKAKSGMIYFWHLPWQLLKAIKLDMRFLIPFRASEDGKLNQRHGTPARG